MLLQEAKVSARPTRLFPGPPAGGVTRVWATAEVGICGALRSALLTDTSPQGAEEVRRDFF
jgi:hypothetical protein